MYAGVLLLVVEPTAMTLRAVAGEAVKKRPLVPMLPLATTTVEEQYK